MEEDLVYRRIAFTKGLESSFIESDPDADRRYTPRILANDEEAGINVLSVLKHELRDCVSFDFSVAFITDSGIQTLIPILLDLKERGIPGRIITSTYLDFNDPGALRTLLEYPNIETRVYQGEHHAKGYFFSKDGISTIIIGSSNLTQRALTCNKEWNVLFRTFEQGGLLLEAKRQFDELWDSKPTIRLSKEWIQEYANHRAQRKPAYTPPFKSRIAPEPLSAPAEPIPTGHTYSFEHLPLSTPANPEAEPGPSETSKATPPTSSTQPSPPTIQPKRPEKADDIAPNNMQSHALEALSLLHERNEPRALLVSATGTGKTYLSAFDIREVRPARVLFVAHRRRILSASRESFQKVLGSRYTYGMYDGASWQSATCLFAMVGTLSRRLEQIPADAFDYIVIDEAHRTGATGYQSILDHFKPAFCLGMTATPNRTDGYDVYGLFNHVIAYRITLKDALSNDMLAPFHYFGIADLEIDDETIDDLSLFAKLTSEERVRHITQRIEQYTVDKEGRRGLIFCNRNEEAQRLSQMFNERGYRTTAISGASTDAERDSAIARLERGELQYIFSVDILNEGVDIPSLNQIIMLRRTESAIVFIQQLGRGLRKADGKEYALVLDFIGNYQSNYLVPIALSGDRTYNKDSLRKAVKEGDTVIPGCSTITFDRVAEARVFRALEQGKFGSARLIRGEYEHLKQVLGRIPSLLDFDANESIDPMFIIRKYGSYPAFLSKYDPDYEPVFSKSKMDMLEFLSRKMAHGKRIEELRL
ncbi:MAG: DEAD/DEAH box helicase family protein, partial [Eggerthellaceae bacterium]|nr:DEAD/DEAH box helicase family protein [Eggerthellaceae bacterium]